MLRSCKFSGSRAKNVQFGERQGNRTKLIVVEKFALHQMNDDGKWSTRKKELNGKKIRAKKID